MVLVGLAVLALAPHLMAWLAAATIKHGHEQPPSCTFSERFREDGYFNMTKAAKQFGKELKHFWESLSTRDYCFELSKATGLYSAESADLSYGLADKSRGRYGGTWAHPKLAVFFARWLDVRFAVACDAMIDDILRGKADFIVTQLETASPSG